MIHVPKMMHMNSQLQTLTKAPTMMKPLIVKTHRKKEIVDIQGKCGAPAADEEDDEDDD